MKPRPEKDLHDSMIRGMISTLEEDGWTIAAADIPGYTDPGMVGRHIPDLIAQKGSQKTIVEVETCSTIESQHTEDQFRDFSAATALFFVEAPESCLDALKSLTSSWGIPVDKWYYREGA